MGKHRKRKRDNENPYMNNYDDITEENNNSDINNFDINNFDINSLTSMLNNIDINQITSLLNILMGGKKEEKNVSKKVEPVENDYSDINLDEVTNVDIEPNICNDQEIKKDKIKRRKKLKADDEIVNLLSSIKAISDVEKAKKLERVIRLYIGEDDQKTS